MWRPQLVALDVDGTLVDESNVVSAAMRDTIQRVVDAGVPVLLATGRSWASALTVIEQLPFERVEHVCSNGAVLVRYPPFEVTDVLTFDPTPVIEKVMQEHPDARLAVEVIGQGYRVTDHFPTGELHGEIEVVPLADLARGEEVTRIVVRDPNASEGEFIALAERLGLTGVSYAIGYTAWLDIAPEGVDKAHGLDRVCRRLGVAASDVLAIGDGRNDIEMVTWAGRGVAVGGAPAELLAVADAVSDPFAEGGTMTELRRWF